MGDKIRVSTEELTSQGNRLSLLSEQSTELTQKTNQAIKRANAALGGKFKWNMQAKLSKVIMCFSVISKDLKKASDVALQSAQSYENTDAVLRKEIGDTLPDNVKNSAPSKQEVYPTTVETNLQPNMGSYSMSQYGYNMTNSAGKNVGCMATAYAIGQSIVTGEPQSPLKYWTGSQATCRDAKVSDYIGVDLHSIYDNLRQGKPVLFHFTHSKSGGQHWVVITGVHGGVDEKNLSFADFNIIDPGDGKAKGLQDVLNQYSGSNPAGMKLFQ